MLIGPVFTREVVTAPRRARLYVSRAAYTSALLVLVCTAWLLVTGTQLVRNLGDMARFGAMLFQILAPLQLALVVFFSALLAAAAVAQEKDRRTLDLLLLTNLTNSELVLGKLLASLLNVLVMLAASLPLFMLCALFGGVAFAQIARVFAVTVATAIAAGSIGSLVALWREKTFQTLALTALLLVFWLAAGEALAVERFRGPVAGHACERVGRRVQPLAGDPPRHAPRNRRAFRPALVRQCQQSLFTGRLWRGRDRERHGDRAGPRVESLARSRAPAELIRPSPRTSGA